MRTFWKTSGWAEICLNSSGISLSAYNFELSDPIRIYNMAYLFIVPKQSQPVFLLLYFACPFKSKYL